MGDFSFANGDTYCGGVMDGMPKGVPHGVGLYRYSHGGCYAGEVQPLSEQPASHAQR